MIAAYLDDTDLVGRHVQGWNWAYFFQFQCVFHSFMWQIVVAREIFSARLSSNSAGIYN